MITAKQVDVYKSYNGDIDGYARTNEEEQETVVSDNDWSLIESFIQDSRIVQKGLFSEAYVKELEIRLNENCDNKETIIKLKSIASNSTY